MKERSDPFNVSQCLSAKEAVSSGEFQFLHRCSVRRSAMDDMQPFACFAPFISAKEPMTLRSQVQGGPI